MTPAVSWLERHHLRRLPAVLLVTLLVFALLGGLGYVLTLQMGRMAEDLPAYVQKSSEYAHALPLIIEVTTSWPSPVRRW